MVEDEARTKWCPFSRTQVVGDNGTQGPGNRLGVIDGSALRIDDNPTGCHCIGSNCMAWRWGERLETEREAYLRGTDLRRTLQSTTEGYCGLAGQP